MHRLSLFEQYVLFCHFCAQRVGCSINDILQGSVKSISNSIVRNSTECRCFLGHSQFNKIVNFVKRLCIATLSMTKLIELQVVLGDSEHAVWKRSIRVFNTALNCSRLLVDKWKCGRNGCQTTGAATRKLRGPRAAVLRHAAIALTSAKIGPSIGLGRPGTDAAELGQADISDAVNSRWEWQF